MRERELFIGSERKWTLIAFHLTSTLQPSHRFEFFECFLVNDDFDDDDDDCSYSRKYEDGDKLYQCLQRRKVVGQSLQRHVPRTTVISSSTKQTLFLKHKQQMKTAISDNYNSGLQEPVSNSVKPFKHSTCKNIMDFIKGIHLYDVITLRCDEM